MSCCVCFNNILELSNWEYQCTSCNDGIICYICFRIISKEKLFLRHNTKIDQVIKILQCPCCRQVNWKRLHNEIVNNIYSDIFDKKNFNSAEMVFLQHYIDSKYDEFDDSDYDDSDYDYDNSDDDDSDDSDDYAQFDCFPSELKIMTKIRLQIMLQRKLSQISKT